MAGAAKKRIARLQQTVTLEPKLGLIDVEHVNAMALPTTADKLPNGDAFDTMIRVKVGKDAGATETFEIYRGVLNHYSGYFRVAIKNIEEGRFAESVDNMISLPDDEVEVFAAFKTWLYTRELPEIPTDGLVNGSSFSPLVRLWCFGDIREIPLLQNQCIDKLVSGMQTRNAVFTDQLPYIYAHTVHGCPLRRMIRVVQPARALFGNLCSPLVRGESTRSSYGTDPPTQAFKLA